mgnify:CR=1 FL=1
MGLLARLRDRFGFARLPRDSDQVALRVAVYRLGTGAALVVTSDAGMVYLCLTKPNALTLVDAILATIEQPEAAPPLAS